MCDSSCFRQGRGETKRKTFYITIFRQSRFAKPRPFDDHHQLFFQFNDNLNSRLRLKRELLCVYVNVLQTREFVDF